MVEEGGTTPVAGRVAERFSAVRERFEEQLLADPGHSAQLAVHVDGELVVDLWGGPHLGGDSVTGVFSATKGVAALTLALLVQSEQLSLDAPVTEYWPEFAQGDPTPVTVRQLLSHQSGRVSVPGLEDITDFCDRPAIAQRVARAAPLWRPGSCFGYHGLTIGVFMEELCRRVTGEDLQALYAREVRDRYGVDFFLGTTDDAEARFVEVLPRRDGGAPPGADDPDGIAAYVFSGDGPVAPPNVPLARRAGVAAVGGVGSARGLARAYAAMVTGVDGQGPRLDPATVARMGEQQCWGVDRVIGQQMCFAVVFMKPQPRVPFASWAGLGHDGAGGALGYADPLTGVAFGYVPAPMVSPGGCDPRAVELSRLVRDCLR
ncbi:serine hydrolase domain-containing protein [Kineococcus arenarius]|uniref:serine hydrolase domain-containing protein n=1 Tax=unclassified Kineococcus TaxID=2621656 RepID=UPI003D7EBADE